MKYDDFITEIRSLLEEGQAFFYDVNMGEHPNEELFDNPKFRQWRTRLRTVVRTIHREGHEPDITLRNFSGFGHDRIAIYNRLLGDTLNELEAVVDHFDKYGAPKKRRSSEGELTPPSGTVTLSWIWRHVSISGWGVITGIAVFLSSSAYALGHWLCSVGLTCSSGG